MKLLQVFWSLVELILSYGCRVKRTGRSGGGNGSDTSGGNAHGRKRFHKSTPGQFPRTQVIDHFGNGILLFLHISVPPTHMYVYEQRWFGERIHPLDKACLCLV